MAITPTKKNKPLAVGDLVKVTGGTHDLNLPDHRIGLIVEIAAPFTVVGSGVYTVRFGSYNLKFHSLFLERVS
jgi:hypothetical protein